MDLLRAHPNGLSTNLAYRLVEQSYRFPASWYRPMPLSVAYEELKSEGIDWQQLSPEQLRSMVKTEPNWQNNLRQVRRDFKNAGWLDSAVTRGTWRLSAEGLVASAARNESELTMEERAIVASQTQVQNGELELLFQDAFARDSAAPAERVLRSVLLRRGQPAFRRSLIDAYDGKCAISCCDAIDALEAAHIVPASDGGEAICSNGLLLRADLHTLFDLDLIGIQPSTRTIVIANAIGSTAYKDLVGIALPSVAVDAAPSQAALEHRWQAYQRINLQVATQM